MSATRSLNPNLPRFVFNKLTGRFAAVEPEARRTDVPVVRAGPQPDPQLPFAWARLRTGTGHPDDLTVVQRAGCVLPHQELTDAQLAALKGEVTRVVTELRKARPDADESAIDTALNNTRPDLAWLRYDGMFGR